MAQGGLRGNIVSPSLEEHLSKFPPQVLDSPCADGHLVKLTECFDEWQLQLSTSLQLTDVEVKDIERAWPRDPARQRVEMFRRWRSKLSSQATYRRLITAFHEAGKADIIDSLHRLVSATPTLPNTQFGSWARNETLVWYGGYLKERHLQVHITAASNQWLPSPTREVFKLAIIKKEIIQRGKIDDVFVRKTIRGQVDDILLEKSPIELENIFLNIERERKVILIDGAPGSGKSTLTIHIRQKWSRGELFQEFTAVILVQLRDPTVQSAKSIADLLPCRDDEMAQQVVSAITSTDGRGILWVLDGWDELPSHLREKSFVRDMVIPPSKSPICHSSVIVTSRPISSGDLSDLASSRIEVLGFTLEEQKKYFIECLNGDTKAVDDLMERLSENPAMEGSCYLPLNASIVAHLYLSDGSLPTTVHGIFSSFVRHSLSRYLCEREGKTRQQAHIQSLDNMPQTLQERFNQLCTLAFTGTIENKVTFSQSDIASIKSSDVVCKLGLLQATPSILSDRTYYSFVHLSIQELLTAVHISRLTASRQISTFNSLLGDSRFGAVLQFYSAITKLRTSRPFLSMLPHWLCPVPAGVFDLIRRIVKKQKKIGWLEPKTLLVSLLHCLYEAQDPSLCQFVAEQLNNRLDLSNTSLTPVDGLAIGYFLSSVSLTTSSAKEFLVHLSWYSLGDDGIKSLMRSIIRHVDPHSTVNTHLDMRLWGNEIHEEGALHIADVLNSTSIVSKLLLYGNRIGDKGLQMIFNAIKQNKVLKLLNVGYCGMADAGVASLANALKTNNTLETLDISDNDAITENGLTCLVEVLSRNSGLVKLLIPTHFGVDRVCETINEARKRSGLPAIKVVHGIW